MGSLEAFAVAGVQGVLRCDVVFVLPRGSGSLAHPFTLVGWSGQHFDHMRIRPSTHVGVCGPRALGGELHHLG